MSSRLSRRKPACAEASAAPRRRANKRPHPLLVFFADHQIEISCVPIALVLALNLSYGPPTFELKSLHPLHLPSLDPTFHLGSWPAKFLFLSYRDPRTGLCLKGPDDFYLVVFWVFVWTLLREVSMHWFWTPLARLGGIVRADNVKRFAEQGWGLLYAAAFWSLGLYILCTSPYAGKIPLMPTDDLFIGYPHFALPPLTKFYYLAQIAFWIETMIALNIEKRRKDYWHMFAHHVITILLIVTSYASNFTRVGNLILCQMDLVDILLPLAKMTKYLGLPTLADGLFGVFLLSWIVTRHIFFGLTIKAVALDLPRIAGYRWDPDAGHFLNLPAHLGFCVLLVALQVLLVLWMCMILKVVKRVVMGGSADDVRSDSEDTEDDLEAEIEQIEDRKAFKS